MTGLLFVTWCVFSYRDLSKSSYLDLPESYCDLSIIATLSESYYLDLSESSRCDLSKSFYLDLPES